MLLGAAVGVAERVEVAPQGAQGVALAQDLLLRPHAEPPEDGRRRTPPLQGAINTNKSKN